MSWATSVRDVWLVARFEILRAMRTWQALALVLMYVVANVGGAYLFIEALSVVEDQIAEGLGVATTRWPGAMMEQVRDSSEVAEMVGFFVGDPDAAKAILAWPLLAIYQLWQGFVFIPFLAATAAAESLSADVRSRAIRFEALRTGRAELVAGRWLGQVGLMLLATVVALASVWLLGMILMVDVDPLELALGLGGLGLRAVLLAIPFAGLGIACSGWTASPAWARVLALAATAGSWVLYGIAQSARHRPWTLVADGLGPVMPQSWIEGLWRPGGDLLLSTTVLVALGVVAMGLGAVRFSSRDL